MRDVKTEARGIARECQEDPRKMAAVKLQYSRVVGVFTEMEEDDKEYDHYEHKADLLGFVIHLCNKQAPIV